MSKLTRKEAIKISQDVLKEKELDITIKTTSKIMSVLAGKRRRKDGASKAQIIRNEAADLSK